MHDPIAVPPSLVTEADDAFHPLSTDDRSWTETAWFAATIPERDLGFWTYPLFRPELGIMSCGIYVWQPGAEEPWELPYYRTWWHLPIPEGTGPLSFALDIGLTYECLEPLSSYRLRFEDAELTADLTFTAIHPPHAVGVVAGGHGHYEQLGRVVGDLWLRGEHLPVDCIDMRDRTWSPRRESRQRMHLTYSFGAGDGIAFLLAMRLDHDRGRVSQLSGFVLADGRSRPLTDGVCDVSRDASGRPEAVVVRGTDVAAGAVEIVGEVRSRFTIPQNPWFGWVCLVRWKLPDGRELYGEHQDAWSPALLRAYRAAGRFDRSGDVAAD